MVHKTERHKTPCARLVSDAIKSELLVCVRRITSYMMRERERGREGKRGEGGGRAERGRRGGERERETEREREMEE